MMSKPYSKLNSESESAYLTDQSTKTIKTGIRKKQCTTEFIYEQEILNHLMSIEVLFFQTNPFSPYQEKHRFIVFLNPSLYDYLIRVLTQLAKKLRLRNQTLFLSKHIFDRVLSTFNSNESEALTLVPNNQILLLLMSALWIAIKYEEIKQPSLAQFLMLIQQCRWLKDYESPMLRKSINLYEAYILSAIKFDLTSPNLMTFIEFFVYKIRKEQTLSKETLNLIYSIALDSLFWQQQMVVSTPSIVAASIITIALETAKGNKESKKQKKEQKIQRSLAHQSQDIYQQLLNNSNKEFIQYQECAKQIKKLLLFNCNEPQTRCPLFSTLLDNHFNQL